MPPRSRSTRTSARTAGSNRTAAWETSVGTAFALSSGPWTGSCPGASAGAGFPRAGVKPARRPFRPSFPASSFSRAESRPASTARSSPSFNNGPISAARGDACKCLTLCCLSLGARPPSRPCQPAQQIQGCDFNLEPHARRWAAAEYSNSHPSAQESNLFRHFAEQAQSGTLNQAWPEMALKTQQVMQACRESALAGGQLVELGLATNADAFRKFKRAFVPEGHYDNSPAFQRWDRPVLCCTRPEGTAESVECGARAFQAGSRPSLRDLGSFDRKTQR